MTEASLYVYGVMRGADEPALDFAAVAAPGAAPFRVGAGALQAIVSAIETDEILPARRNLLAHAKALETLMEVGPVLPMRFGLIAPSRAAIEATLAANASALLARLQDLGGRAEYGVRVSWSREALMRAVVARQPELREAYQALAGKPEAATHYQRVELGRRVEAAIAALREEEAARCADAIAAVVARTALHEPEDELTILKLDCLVETAETEALGAVLERLQSDRPDAVSIKLVGPAPAYNFTKLALDWAEAA